MSNSLDLPQMTAGTADKDDFINDLMNLIDQSVTGSFNIDASANCAPATADIANFVRLNAINVPAASSTISLPAVPHLYVLSNDAASLGPVLFKVGTTAVQVGVGKSFIGYIDGTANGLQFVSSASGTLAALGDVDESVVPQDGQALVYNGSVGKWKPGNVAGSDGGNGGATSLEKAFVAPPNAASWTKQNFQAWTHVQDYGGPGGGTMLFEDFGLNTAYGNVNSIRTAIMALADPHWIVTARFRRHGASVVYSNHGLCLRDNGSGNSKLIGVSDTKSTWGGLHMTGDNNFASDEGYTGGYEVPCDWWQRLSFDGNSTTFSISRDGVYFSPVRRWMEGAAKAGFLSNGATHIGFGFSVNNSGGSPIANDLTVLSWEYAALA